MKILLQTRFFPSVGGIETLSLVLRREWQELGCEVTVSTDVAADNQAATIVPDPVYRRASHRTLLSLWRSHDAVVLMNVSLKAIWPMMFCKKAVVLTHHSPYWCDRDGNRDWRESLKVAIVRRSAWNICVSRFVRDAVGLKRGHTIPNCYDDSVFRLDNTQPRDRDVIFVGRLVSDKGADLLLNAVARSENGQEWSVTIVGGGPEEDSLRRQADRLGLSNIRFLGALPPADVASELRQHRLMVVPSLVKEAFGIVALEGLACGCTVLVSDGGGLPEAVGEAGMTFRSGDPVDLAQKMEFLLSNDATRNRLSSLAQEHLQKHTAKAMAQAYLEVVSLAVNDGAS